MTRLSILLLTLLSLLSACHGQAETLEVKEKKNSNNQYKDFVIDGDKIWGLTTHGKLAFFDSDNGDLLPNKVKNESAIIVLTKDREGNIVIGDKSKSIKTYKKESNSWVTLFNFEHTLLGITFDSKNNCYLITSKGIFDNSTKKYLYPDSSQNFQIRHEAGWFREPAYLTDKNDNIWIGFGYGEWGGELFIFNTANKKFIAPQLKEFPISLNPVKSIFESNENVFVTSGLMHFSTRGSIAKFDNFQSTLVFESRDHKKYPDDSTNDESVEGEYIGPGTYNEIDQCIYFYSQNGIYSGNPKNDLSKIGNWVKIFHPKLHWTNGQPDAIGSPMNVLKLKFITADKLIFVSQNDGIGIYSKKRLILTR